MWLVFLSGYGLTLPCSYARFSALKMVGQIERE
jgi:hypothetical protein